VHQNARNNLSPDPANEEWSLTANSRLPNGRVRNRGDRGQRAPQSPVNKKAKGRKHPKGKRLLGFGELPYSLGAKRFVVVEPSKEGGKLGGTQGKKKGVSKQHSKKGGDTRLEAEKRRRD